MTVPTMPAAPVQNFAQREPALTYGGGLTAASLIIDAVVGLGIPLTDTAKIVIILVVSVVGPFAGTLLTRMKVSPIVITELEGDAEQALKDLGGLPHPEVVQPSPEIISKSTP